MRTLMTGDGKTPAVVDDHAVIEFTTGACGYLAVVLHDLTGWPLRVEYEHPPSEGDVAHIWVVNDDGKAVDINGVHPDSWARTKYSGPIPGRISVIGRPDALGREDLDYMEWAKELIEANPEHFGNPPSLNVPKFR